MKTTAKISTMFLVLTLPAAGYYVNIASAMPGMSGASASTAVATTEKAAQGMPQGHQSMQPAEEAGAKITGKVVETMTSGGYTYALLENKGVKTWVAMPETAVAVGQELVFDGGSEMWNFKSKSLGRTFDKIMFCNAPLKKVGGEEDGKMAGKVSVGSETAVTVKNEKIKVEKATGENAYTVAEVYANKAGLDKKRVVVRGKVVKVSAGIMDKNWIHVQDGSGDAKTKTNNLVVTSQDLAKVGDVVTVTGTLYMDKDFGGGYKYDVIVEEATIKP